MRTTLRLRLVLTAVAATVVALVIANALIYRDLKGSLIDRVDASLRTVQLPREGDGGPRRLASSVYFEDRNPDGSTRDVVLAIGDDGRTLRPKLPVKIDVSGTSGSPTGPARFFTVGSIGSSTKFRVKASSFVAGRTLILAATLDDVERTLARARRSQILLTSVVAALAGLFAYVAIRRSLRTLDDMRRTTAAITTGDLAARVVAAGPRDVQVLAQSFNHMVDALDRSLADQRKQTERIRRFVDDAAHELRTPTTAIVASTELLEQSERPPEESARLVRNLVGESHRLRRLVDELLVLARNDDRGGTEHEMVDLVPVAVSAVDRSILVGPAWPIDLSVPSAAWCRGAVEDLSRVFDNLLSNVRSHTPPGTPARVSVSVDLQVVRVDIDDDGPGFPSESRDRVFDRFWRGGSPADAQGSGSGLGLAIVASVVARHGGTVEAREPAGGGASVRIELPVAYF